MDFQRGLLLIAAVFVLVVVFSILRLTSDWAFANLKEKRALAVGVLVFWFVLVFCGIFLAGSLIHR